MGTKPELRLSIGDEAVLIALDTDNMPIAPGCQSPRSMAIAQFSLKCPHTFITDIITSVVEMGGQTPSKGEG
jgi:hypothetical protein